MVASLREQFLLDRLIDRLNNIGENPKDDPGDMLALFIGNDAVRGAYHRAQERVRNNRKEGQ